MDPHNCAATTRDLLLWLCRLPDFGPVLSSRDAQRPCGWLGIPIDAAAKSRPERPKPALATAGKLLRGLRQKQKG